MKKKSSLVTIFVFFFLSFLFMYSPGQASQGNTKSHFQPLTEKVEKTITRASDMFEKGQIKKGHPYVARISSNLTLTFTAENFDSDLEKAFGVLDKLMTQAKREASPRKATSGTGSVRKEAALKKPAPIQSSSPPSDRISALREAESHHPKERELSAKEVPLQYSSFKSYNALHQGRVAQEDKEAEADMQTVGMERQQAEAELQQRRARKQQLQAQAMKWQDELDREAAETATKAAAYEAEHSFGSYVKRFFTTVLQTAVGSFTGAFIGNIGTHLADKAVGSLFHHSSSTLSRAASAGTSSAINSAAGATGQAVTNGVTSAITRGSRAPTASKPISPARTWHHSSVKRNTNSKYTPLVQRHYNPVIHNASY